MSSPLSSDYRPTSFSISKKPLPLIRSAIKPQAFPASREAPLVFSEEAESQLALEASREAPSAQSASEASVPPISFEEERSPLVSEDVSPSRENTTIFISPASSRDPSPYRDIHGFRSLPIQSDNMASTPSTGSSSTFIAAAHPPPVPGNRSQGGVLPLPSVPLPSVPLPMLPPALQNPYHGGTGSALPQIPPHPDPGQASGGPALYLPGNAPPTLPPPQVSYYHTPHQPSNFGGEKNENFEKSLVTLKLLFLSLHLQIPDAAEREQIKIDILESNLGGRAYEYWIALNPVNKATFELASTALK